MERRSAGLEPFEMEAVEVGLHGEELDPKEAVPAADEVNGPRVLHQRRDGSWVYAPGVVDQHVVDIDAVEVGGLGMRWGESTHVVQRQVITHPKGVESIIADVEVAGDDDQLAEVLALQLHVQWGEEVRGVPVHLHHRP